MTISECYIILELDQEAPWEEIKKAYRTKAKLYHPDKHHGNPVFDCQFKKVTKAYKILDGHHRKYKVGLDYKKKIIKYDSIKKDKFLKKTYRQYNSPLKQKPFTEWKNHLKKLICNFEKSYFPLDLLQGVTIEEHIAKLGGMIRVRTSKETFNIKLPIKVKNGFKFKIKGKGQKSFFSDRRGDFYLKIRLVPIGTSKPGYINLFYDMNIKQRDLLKGKVFTLHTIQGPIKFFPPKSTLDGQTFVLKARPDNRSSNTINHILTIYLI